jgi:hypothetical protein
VTTATASFKSTFTSTYSDLDQTKLPEWQPQKCSSYILKTSTQIELQPKQNHFSRKKPMIISDLNHMEIVSTAVVQGAGRSGGRGFVQNDKVSVEFNTTNKFKTIIEGPAPVYTISASAGAKGVAEVGSHFNGYTFTKGDTLAVVDEYGNSFSLSTSAALINW